MITKQYTLPDWEFIGGTTQPYEFKLKTEEGHPYDVEGAIATVLVAPFVNSDDVIFISHPIQVEPSEEDNGSHCIVKFELPLSLTQNWRGKYIYQIVVEAEADDGERVIAAQKGRMFVHKGLSMNSNTSVG